MLLLFFFISNKIYSSVILDYETEIFIKKINNLILSVNNLKNNIKFHIIYDENPNAFVNENNEIYISSGLIEKSPSYVALLGVLAHEIGHIEKFHIAKRKESIENINSINMLGSLSIIAGSIISNNPRVIEAMIANKVGINNFYLNFSKNQEREADHYAVETLNKLNLPTKSLLKLLNIIEDDSLKKGNDPEYHKFSTHPVYTKRYEIINEKKEDSNSTIDMKLENEFSYIRAKFIGFSSKNNSNFQKYLNEKYIDYANSIFYSKNGDLINSLKILNNIIKNNDSNIFLLETKGDILLSYGYKKEAIKFYNKVLTQYPKNNYVQLRIFNNIDVIPISKRKKNKLFMDNINLLFKFPKYNILYHKYKFLSESLNKNNWLDFFNTYLNKDNLNKKTYNDNLNKIMTKTSDNKLIKLINFHLNL